jgi:hypothetical protein
LKQAGLVDVAAADVAHLQYVGGEGFTALVEDSGWEGG